ncbi:phosphate signaling complex protein PhoU [Halorussus gelatinilyticus]|uniref:Phosphate-specific transport system accessory protein PhoU n=1 Tax=Halorussus gelatinilyticus TaxID=2937524 RepID=A0A8U0IIK3_9EURY|nr:phosphate signaling complex protein PhoU [Halorussus gelatinilyticus]UPW00927.1 phosphate signaling complex protein PhoU [Halorussus gelatinilyticus]
MPRTGYQNQLETLREDVVGMGETVVRRLRMGLVALDRQDHDLAWEVIDGDDDINQRYLDLERDCIDLVALQQPVASDLRLVVASFKIITDLERVADLAANLGEYALYADRKVVGDVALRDLGEVAAEMVADAVAAYDAADPAACEALAERDDELDRRCERASELVVRDLIETELSDDADSEAVEHLLQEVSNVLLTIRDLERVGDHAVNIAARTLYMVENDDRLIE